VRHFHLSVEPGSVWEECIGRQWMNVFPEARQLLPVTAAADAVTVKHDMIICGGSTCQYECAVSHRMPGVSQCKRG